MDAWLGAKHRSRLRRMEKAKAVKATAHELARLIYAMLRDGQEYVERTQQEFEDEHRQRKILHLHRQARSMGCKLVPADTPTARAA